MIWGTQYCFYLTCFAGTVIVMFDFPLSCTTYLYWSAFKATGFDLELKIITNIQGYLYSISKKISLQVFYFIFFLLKRRFKFMTVISIQCTFPVWYLASSSSESMMIQPFTSGTAAAGATTLNTLHVFLIKIKHSHIVFLTFKCSQL